MSTEVPIRPLAEIVSQRTEKAFGVKDPRLPYVGLEHLDSGSPRLARTAHSSISASTNGVFYVGDVLFGKLRPYLRKSVGADRAGYCSTDILVLEPRDEIDPVFASKLFQSDIVFERAAATSMGTKMPRTSWRSLRELVVFCPPLPEQQRIAEILDTVDEAIRKTEEVIAKLQQMKQGLLHDLLTRGIDDNGELRDPDRHPEQFKPSELGRIPRGWDVSPLGSLLLERPKNGLYKAPFEIGSGMLMVGQTAFTAEDSVDFSSARRARVAHAEFAQFGLRAGDVLVTRVYATVDGVGRSVLVPECPEDAVYESNMMRVRVDRDRIDSGVLHVWMKSYRSRLHIRGNASSSNQTSINQRGLMSLPCPIPVGEEQGRIVERISRTDEEIRCEELSLAKLRQLKSGLMDDLLTGRVRTTPPEPTP